MRIKIGRIVDIEQDVNLVELSPLDRIIAAATNAYHNTGMYKRRYAASEERKEEQRRQIREKLTDSLLSVIHPELDNNKTLSSRGDQCVAMLVKVPPRFKSFLVDVLSSHEFDAYNTKIIQPSQSLSKFCEAPFLVYIENKGGGQYEVL